MCVCGVCGLQVGAGGGCLAVSWGQRSGSGKGNGAQKSRGVSKKGKERGGEEMESQDQGGEGKRNLELTD